ncbi:MAG: hypothetical protein CFE45_20665, partial [Burkholderiales bacterium PBB5]
MRALPLDQLRGLRRGVEKESLRALPSGGLALTPHPVALGAALYITKAPVPFVNKVPQRSAEQDA